MKMKSGTAARTCAVAVSSSFWMHWASSPSRPNDWTPKITANVSMVSATGNPVRIAIMSAGNIQSGDINLTFGMSGLTATGSEAGLREMSGCAH